VEVAEDEGSLVGEAASVDATIFVLVDIVGVAELVLCGDVDADVSADVLSGVFELASRD
jgi:hypothetical protein